MKKSSFFLLFIVLIGCTKEIEIPIPDQSKKMVVFSTITPFTMPRAKDVFIDIVESIKITDEYSNNNVIKNATVLYYENNTIVDTIKYEEKGYFISKDIQSYPKEGNFYAIKVITDAYETVTSSTTIPSKVSIIDTSITPISYLDKNNLAISEVTLTFIDPPNEVNYYAIAVSEIGFDFDSIQDFYDLITSDEIITTESYYPSLTDFDIKQPKELLFSDKTINGQQKTIKVNYFPPQGEDSVKYVFEHFITIHLRNVTPEYYLYKTTLLQQVKNKQENILYGMGESVDVISNINNGYGLFAGFNFDITSMYIKEQVY